jgi:hypothetical protein
MFRNVCNAGCEVVTGMLLKIHMFWDVMPKASVIAGEISLAEDVHVWRK